MKYSFRFLTSLIVLQIISTTLVIAQPFTVTQNVTGSSRSDIRGQSFRPASQGSGTGTITTAESFVFLHSIAVIFSGGVAPSTLYVYGTLAPSTTELDNGSYGNLVTQSTSKTTDFPYTIYHFNEAPILKEGRYYALFRQDVQLEFGASANNIGPYNGGSMITNDGNAPIANDYTDLKFVVNLENNNNLSYQKDVDALKALHLATNGASWTNKWDLSSNPQAWYGVQWHYNRVWYLDLQNNNLSGTLPQELGNLIELRSFRLNDNNIGGSIPPQLGNLKKLSVFFLHKNKLTGSIPETLGNLTNVEMFYLMDNLLEGPIPPELGNLANAMGMGLSQNKLTGTIPASFGNLTRLTQLMVNDNELQGSLPAQLAYLTTTEIWLDGNRYNFGAFEPLATFFASNTGAILTPQSKLPVEDDFILVDLGESLTVTISTPGSNNRYQWFRGTTSVSSSSASPDFTLTNFQSSMTGKYTCQVTNTALPGKTLLSDEIVIDHPLSFTASVLEIKASSIRLSTQFSHSGTVYAIITTEDKPAPSATQLIAGKDGNNETPVKVISHILQNQNTLVTGLTPNTSYKIYYLGRTSLQQGEVKNISITTLSGILFASTYPKINEVTSNQIKLALKTTIAGTAYFVALPYNSPSPTATQVAAKQDASGTSTTLGSSDILTANTELITAVTGLNPQTLYDIYVTAKDAEGLFTEVYKLEIETITNTREKIAVNVFPNPVVNLITIENNTNTILNIRIIDILGRELYSESSVAHRNEIDARPWRSGLYFLEIKNLNGIKLVKLFKD